MTDRPLRDPAPPAAATPAVIRYGGAVLACAATSALAVLMLPWLDLANIVMLFLLTVVLVALRLGRGPSVLATMLSVAAFDYFCVPPRLDFAVSDAQYLVTFAVMLGVGLIIGQLTSGLRAEARAAATGEARARALYELARDLSNQLQADGVVRTAVAVIGPTFATRVAILLPDAQGRVALAPAAPQIDGVDLAVAQWAYDHAAPAGRGTSVHAESRLRYLPLRAAVRTRGVLAVEWADARMSAPEQQRHLDTFAALGAMALERVHYVEVAQTALVRMESERLRHSLLAALSHDLRTPVAAMIGLAESLALTAPPLSSEQSETAREIAAEARRMGELIDKLLDMARLASGPVELRREWQSIEEVVGAALRSARPALEDHDVKVVLDPALPLVEFDAVLIERVLANLLENAGKYTPRGSRIEISARVAGSMLEVCVSDNGPGLRAGEEEAVFEKFVRGSSESPAPGVGLGLAISRAIVQAHGGTIDAGRANGRGARFCFRLPVAAPPAVPAEVAP